MKCALFTMSLAITAVAQAGQSSVNTAGQFNAWNNEGSSELHATINGMLAKRLYDSLTGVETRDLGGGGDGIWVREGENLKCTYTEDGHINKNYYQCEFTVDSKGKVTPNL